MKNLVFTFVKILVVVIFMMPAFNYACGSKSAKSCCKKEIAVKSAKKDCCGKKTDGNQKGCRGKCGHSNCTTSSAQFSLVSQNEFIFQENCFDFLNQKETIYYYETAVSSGFHSLWLIPKIS